MKRFIRAGASALCVIGILTAVWGIASFLSRSEVSAWRGGYRIAAILQKGESSSFWSEIWRGVRWVSDSRDVGISVYSYESRDEIGDLLETALLSRVDAVIMCAPTELSAQVTDALAGAKESGIPVVCVDSDVGGEYRDAFIGVDNRLGGLSLGATVSASYLPGKRLLIINNTRISQTIGKRRDGFFEEISLFLEDNAVGYIDSPNSTEQILALQETLLSADRPDYIASFSPGSTVRTARLIKQLRLTDKVALFGFGETPEALEFVEDGIIHALMAQDCFHLGTAAAETAIGLLEGIAPENPELLRDLIEITPENIGYIQLAKDIMETE